MDVIDYHSFKEVQPLVCLQNSKLERGLSKGLLAAPAETPAGLSTELQSQGIHPQTSMSTAHIRRVTFSNGWQCKTWPPADSVLESESL